MNKDIFHYKLFFVTAALIFCYAYIHIKFTGVYVDVALDKWIDLDVRLPFAQRLLVPSFAHFLRWISPLNYSESFFLLEVLFSSLLFGGLYILLRESFSHELSMGLGWLFILLLPLITVINYPFSIDGQAVFYYPCDTASLFFTIIGLTLCLKQRWVWLVFWIGLATLNRESSILLVLLIPALHWHRVKHIIIPFLFALLVYVITRFFVYLLVHTQPGSWLEFYSYKFTFTNLEFNLHWLMKKLNIFVILFGFAGMPLFWFAFSDFVPTQFRPIKYVFLAYFIGLLMVGKFTEPRIFGEIVVLLYYPVCLAVKNWIQGIELEPPERKGFFYYGDRYAVITILLLIAVFQRPVVSLLEWFLGLKNF